MTEIRLQEIEEESARLLAARPLGELPVNVRAIAKSLGIALEFANFDDEVSGVLVRTADATMIGVNWSHHPNRQRFTIAHEIGHYLLHPGGTFVDKSTTARFRDRQAGSGSEVEEREANRFAATLLMPAEAIEKASAAFPFAIDDEDQLRDFSDRFGVSSQAMLIRLKELGFVEF